MNEKISSMLEHCENLQNSRATAIGKAFELQLVGKKRFGTVHLTLK